MWFIIVLVYTVLAKLSSAQCLKSNCALIQTNNVISLNKPSKDVVLQTNCLEPFCSCLTNSYLSCENFTSFSDLNFSSTNFQIFEHVELRPRHPIDLNKKLKLDGLNLNGRLNIFNLKSISIEYNPFKQINYLDTFNLAIFDSVFNYKNKCEPSSKLDTIFSNIRLNEFRLTNITFERPICSYMFQDSLIEQFVVINPIGIFRFDENLNKSSNTTVSKVELKFRANNQQRLDTHQLLNVDFFKDVRQISLGRLSNLDKIASLTFKELLNVKTLIIPSSDLKTVLSKGNDWLGYLNFYQQPIFWENTFPLDLSALQKQIFKMIITHEGGDSEIWPFSSDRDICLFKSFPHDKLVFPFLVPSSTKFKCSCTIFWLYKNLAKFQQIFNLNENIMPIHCFSDPHW